TRLVQETMDVFVKARLLTANAREGTEITIEVSHEAVLREWKRLAGWLYEASTDIRFQQSFSEDVAGGEQRKQPQDRLYRGIKLKEARDWAKRNKPNQQEAAFLRASVKRRTFSLVILMLVALLLVSSIGVAGWFFLTRPADPTRVTTLDDN